jgi:APA family basic amino acid/polyamine antiporter
MQGLKRGALGMLFGLMAIIGGAIGMGILRMPHDMAHALPNLWIYFGMWLVGSIFVLLAIPGVSELSATFDRSGGYYVFAKETFGSYAGFVVGYMDWLSWCGGIALIALVSAQEFVRLIPSLAGYERGVAVAIWGVFTALNWLGLRWGSGTQIITSTVKALGLIALIVAFFLLGQGGALHELKSADSNWQEVSIGALVFAFQAVIFAFAGWEAPIYMGEEVRDAGRTIPRALLVGTLSVICIYLLINAAILCVLPYSAVAEESLPAAAAARSIFGGSGESIITILALLIMMGAINSGMLIVPRVLYALGKDGLFARQAATVNEGGTPGVALLLSGAAILALLLSGTFESVLAVMGFFYVVNVTLAQLALFVLRWRDPNRARPYRAFGYPFVPALALLLAVGFLFAACFSDPLNSGYAIGAMALSFPVYRLFRYFKGKGERQE